MTDYPQVKFEREPRDLDTCLDTLISHRLLDEEYKEEVKLLLMCHNHREHIIDLLMRYDNIRFYFDNQSISEIKAVSNTLEELNSPILIGF